jgi:hypothetical protein
MFWSEGHLAGDHYGKVSYTCMLAQLWAKVCVVGSIRSDESNYRHWLGGLGRKMVLFDIRHADHQADSNLHCEAKAKVTTERLCASSPLSPPVVRGWRLDLLFVWWRTGTIAPSSFDCEPKKWLHLVQQ